MNKVAMNKVKCLSFIVLSLSVLLMSVFLLGCSSADDAVDDDIPVQSEDVEEGSADETLDQTSAEANSISEDEKDTLEGWICVSKAIKRYRLANGTFTSQKVDCTLGCDFKTNDCRKSQVCESGFKCKDSNTLAFQREFCTWEREQECKFGCENNRCKDPPEGYNESAADETATVNPSSAEGTVTDEEEVSSAPKYVVELYKNVEVTVGGTAHKVRLYNIDPGKAIVEVDNLKSGWLNEGESFSFNTGVKITVKSVLFQAYASGKKEIEFTLE